MHLRSLESVVVPAPREQVFERTFDIDGMPELLVGWGPFPALERAELLGGATGLAVGVKRRGHHVDGSALDEEILVHEPPRRHGYRLFAGFQGLAKLLVTEGISDWTFEDRGDETRVVWAYEFTLTSPLVLPLALPTVKVAFAKMQRVTLEQLRKVFRDSPRGPG